MVMKRSIAKLVRKKLSDITNTQTHPKLNNQVEKPADKSCIEELLKEKDALMQLLAERDKIIEVTGAELVRLRDNVDELQQQNRNLAQSNSQMLVELNLGRERMKTLQHEILCKAALFHGKDSVVRGIEDMNPENNEPLLKEGVEKTEQPLVKASNNVEKLSARTTKPTKRSRSTCSITASIKDANESKEKKDIRPVKKNSSQTDYARAHLKILNSTGREEETFGEIMRKTEEKVHPYKGMPPKVKFRRLELE